MSTCARGVLSVLDMFAIFQLVFITPNFCLLSKVNIYNIMIVVSQDSGKSNSDLIYDICGWVILGIGILSWVAMAKSNGPPHHPR